MNFILLPFLLAASVTDDRYWENGPEYTFNVRVGMISNLYENNGRFMGTTLCSKLKCRPRERNRMICRFEDTKIAVYNHRAFDFGETLPPNGTKYKPFGLGDGTFEIQFDERGIEKYAFENTDKLMGFVANMYRMIANQLSVGANLKGRDSEFYARENFTMGECSVVYNVLRGKPVDRTEVRNFELSPLVDVLEFDGDESIEMFKDRVLDTCVPTSTYFFGTRYTYGIILRDTADKLTNSSSRMYISKNNFVSETRNAVDIYSTNNDKLGSVLDHIYVDLESIDPAVGEVETLSNPVYIDVIVK